jgi:hypothetical protein
LIPNAVFIGLRYLFLALMYIFLILVVRAIYRDMREPQQVAVKERRKKRKRQRPELVVLAAERNQGARYRLHHQLVIGRSEGSDIIIDDTYASQQHARVFPENASCYVEDLGSTNGTYVNGRKISYPLELRPGDRIKIGKTVFEFRR